ncbi:MAG: hypothetical protein LBQ51_01975 [Desulfovibrio sp.]|jgi:hypothetical protein|nr:hypothetical protein [Desulfovibrio sp.]
MNTKNKVIGAALLGVLLLAACFFLIPPRLEKKTEARVTEFLEKLPGDVSAGSVKADFWKGEVVLQAVHGTWKRPDGIEFVIEAEKLRALDINAGSLAASGPVRLLGLLHVERPSVLVRASMPGLAQDMTQSIKMSDLDLRDISGDLNRLIAVLRDDGTPPAEISEIMDAIAAFSVGEAAMNGYNVDTTIGSITVRSALDSFTGRNMRLTGAGPCEWRGFRCNLLGMEIVSMEKARSASFSVPNFFAFAADLQQDHDGAKFSRAFAQALENSPIVLRDAEVEGFSISLGLLTPKGISIKKSTMDFTLGARRGAVRFTLSALNLPPDIYRFIPWADDLASAYGKDLNLEAVLDLDAALEEENGSPDVKSGNLNVKKFSLTDPALASFDSDGAFTLVCSEGGDLECLLAFGAEVFLKNYRVALEDTGLLNVFFTAGEDTSGQRAAAAARIREEAAGEDNVNAVKILPGIAQLVAAPGRLLVTLNPAAPVSLDKLDESDLNPAVEYTPR